MPILINIKNRWIMRLDSCFGTERPDAKTAYDGQKPEGFPHDSER